jgi:formylglycine-generating enzyme
MASELPCGLRNPSGNALARSLICALASLAAALACRTQPSPLPEVPGVSRPSATEPPSETKAHGLSDATNLDAGVDGILLLPDANSAAAIFTLGEPRLLQFGYSIREHQAPRKRWRQVETLNWQAMSALSTQSSEPETARQPWFEALLRVEPRPSNEGCPAGMARVRGNFLVGPDGKEDDDAVERAQDKACLGWSGRVCRAYSTEKWQVERDKLKRRLLDTCIDVFEYPNRAGEYPLTVTTFSESEAYCKKEGKRLCSESEWTFACEGEEGLPYPYGYERDAKTCAIDRPRIPTPEDTFLPRTLHRTALGIDQMWQGEPSGAMPRCVSPFGVHDMTGNVDEWTRTVRTWGYRMILKGGHWSYVRARCRPQTRGHGPRYVNVETGFRCCHDPIP